MLPWSFVVVKTTGTITPPTPEEPMLETEERVPAEIADETLVIVLPAESVVVTDASDTETAEDTVIDDSTLLPAELVVVMATTVGVMDVT